MSNVLGYLLESRIVDLHGELVEQLNISEEDAEHLLIDILGEPQTVDIILSLAQARM